MRQTGPDAAAAVATGLRLPISLGFGPEGARYVSLPEIVANAGEGVKARIDVAAASAATPAAAPEAIASPACRVPTGAGTSSG